MWNEEKKVVTVELKNVIEFSFLKDGSFFYAAEKPILSKEVPGNSTLATHWLPTENIIEITGTNKIPFSTLLERKEYVDKLWGHTRIRTRHWALQRLCYSYLAIRPVSLTRDSNSAPRTYQVRAPPSELDRHNVAPPRVERGFEEVMSLPDSESQRDVL